jgi:decaprenylphospho-beta-D-erythro-pentofuranosid-2-ulose 2-reductase
MFQKPLMSVPQRILVLGATSAIAQSAIKLWAVPDAKLYLIGRDKDKLEVIAADARVRGAEVVVQVIRQFGDMAVAEKSLAAIWRLWEGIDGVLIAHGWLPDQFEAQDNPAMIAETIAVNGTSVCQWLGVLVPHFTAQNHGWLAVTSSVAGDRGRAKMYVYGAAKAMVSHTLQGLRQRLADTGVRVLDIRPGPVRTPMTANLGSLPLMAEPDAVGEAVVRACGAGLRGKNRTVYVPWVWWPIMAVLRHIPEGLWLKMKI